MSHECTEPGRSVIYKMPARPSDKLRTLRFSQFFDTWHGAPFKVCTADGWSWCSSAFREPAFVATFRTRDALDALIGDGHEAKLGAIFLDGGLDIQGDIFVLLAVAEFTLRHSDGLSRNLVRTVGRLTIDICRRVWPGRRASAYPNWHCAPCPLDLPVEFFEPWLGPLLFHSCALLTDGQVFDAAQRSAIERACSALQLERGDRLLDVACGWGSLLQYAAEFRGVSGQGIAATPRQAEAAASRIGRMRLAQPCNVECRNLRSAPYRPESFDKIVDIGIFEHVVAAELASYLACMHSLLVPGGRLLLHLMTRTRNAAVAGLYPDLYAPSLSAELEIAESAGMEVMALESLQRDYEETLRTWTDHLRQSTRDLSFHRGYRTWLLFLVETAVGLHTGDLQVHRVLLRRPPASRSSVACSTTPAKLPGRLRRSRSALR